MPTARAVAEREASDLTDEELRKSQILDAALQCFMVLGISKTSVQDVARQANVSRGTVYRYFEDRQRLVDGAIEFGALRYQADAAAAMAGKETLADQIAAFAEVTAETLVRQRTRTRLAEGDSEFLQHYVSDSKATLGRLINFLLPYVEAAKKRGEVGRDVKPVEASEWLARAIMSLTSAQDSVGFDMSKPKAVGRYFKRFAVNGLR
jgi:AcrR family transcriptional regulator